MASLSWPPRAAVFLNEGHFMTAFRGRASGLHSSGSPSYNRNPARTGRGDHGKFPLQAGAGIYRTSNGQTVQDPQAPVAGGASADLALLSFRGHSGWAMRVRPVAIKSACPSCRAFSANQGSLILPTPITGM